MTSTASTTSGAKISMFGAKSGFVIPKNKLSGSLIPIFQRGKTLGGSDSTNGSLTNLGKRKTKWGPDLTQDSSVKKGRVLAYQKRLDQITQQLESGTHEAENNGESALVSQKDFDKNTSDIAEHLEFEKREVIGEILELNPRYKAPPDYKPVMKEARLPIHVKEHSDFSFLSVILSSQGDTLKRLEKETGAKVQIFGTKNGGEKVELSPSDENEFQVSWLDLYFQISSDTYEKVDAAIAVVELLISSVSGNTIAGPAPPSSESEGISMISTIPANSNSIATDPTSEQPSSSSVQPPQSQFEHGSSIPLASNQVPCYPPLNPSAPNLDNRIRDQELPTNAMNPNPLMVQQPLPIPHNTSVPPGSQVPRPSDLLSFSLSSTSRDFSMVTPQGSSSHLGFSPAPPYSGNQILQQIGPRSTTRPSTLFTFQPVPNSVPRPDIFSSNMVQSVRSLAPNFISHLVSHQPGTEQRPSIPFPSSINLKHLVENAFGGSLRPMSAHIGGRPAGPIPSYLSTNTAPRPFHDDFSFLPQRSNIVRMPEISPRLNSQQPAHLPPHLGFRAPPSVTQPASQHFGQSLSLARQQLFGRQMDQQPPNHPPAPFHDGLRSNLQNFGPPLPQMMSRNFHRTQLPQHSSHFPPRPVFRHDNLNPSGQPQFRHRFNTGANQVYDPFSPSDG